MCICTSFKTDKQRAIVWVLSKMLAERLQDLSLKD
jgi:hypothetical protein